MAALSQRDRVLVAEVLTRFLAANLEKRGISETYLPECYTVSALDIARLIAALQLDHGGDDVALVQQVAEDIEREGEDNAQEWFPQLDKLMKAVQ